MTRPRRDNGSFALAAIAAVAGIAVATGLGLWQLERLQWKRELLARIEARIGAPPGAIPAEAEWPRWDAGEEEYRRVRLTGTFEHARAAPVHGNSPRDSRTGDVWQGYFILTPLRLDNGAFVIVNRGFVPTEIIRGGGYAVAAQGPAEVTLTGLLRASQQRGWFVPEDDPRRDEWFTRDAAAIAKARGLVRVAPFIVDADATPNPGGWPRGGLTVVRFPNNHLEYALTWFGLAAALAGVFALSAWRRRDVRAAA
jgi:surfeit locus 1 family protein